MVSDARFEEFTPLIRTAIGMNGGGAMDAVNALADVPADVSCFVLGYLLLFGEHTDVRQAAATSLGNLDDARGAPWLRASINKDNEYGRVHAAAKAALGVLGAAEDGQVPWELPFLKSLESYAALFGPREEGQAQRHAARLIHFAHRLTTSTRVSDLEVLLLLGHKRSEDFGAALEGLLDNRGPERRIAAIAEIGYEDVLSLYAKDDGDERVRRHAREMLADLGSENVEGDRRLARIATPASPIVGFDRKFREKLRGWAVPQAISEHLVETVTEALTALQSVRPNGLRSDRDDLESVGIERLAEILGFDIGQAAYNGEELELEQQNELVAVARFGHWKREIARLGGDSYLLVRGLREDPPELLTKLRGLALEVPAQEDVEPSAQPNQAPLGHGEPAGQTHGEQRSDSTLLFPAEGEVEAAPPVEPSEEANTTSFGAPGSPINTILSLVVVAGLVLAAVFLLPPVLDSCSTSQEGPTAAPAEETTRRSPTASHATVDESEQHPRSASAESPTPPATANEIERPLRSGDMRARHVLISHADAERSQSSRTRAEARALAERLQAVIVAGEHPAGERPFEDIARTYSDCPSARDGGVLPDFSPGHMVRPFEEAVMALEPQEVSGIVETPFGYHIIERLR